MMPLELDNPFWQFSLRVYGTPGVAEECLEVQDETWRRRQCRCCMRPGSAPTRGIVLEEADLMLIEQAISAWSASVVKPLRGVRRTMKSMPDAADPQVQALRKRVAETELLSEQIEQAFLFRMADGVGRPGDRDCARERLCRPWPLWSSRHRLSVAQVARGVGCGVWFGGHRWRSIERKIQALTEADFCLRTENLIQIRAPDGG